MKSALFSLFGENFWPVWRVWQLWRSQIRLGQNVLRMTWKERFVQFSWKAHYLPVLRTISGQCDDFKNFDAQKCDLAKTCSAWPEKSVLYNFHEKRTIFPFWTEFQASGTILTTLTLKNAIWAKRAAHDMKRAFCTIFMESALFSCFEENFRPVLRFWNLTLKNAIWPKRPPHDLKRAFCTIFMKSALFSRFEENLSKSNNLEKFDPQKYDLGKTSCAWPETTVLYNCLWKGHCFPF